MGNWDGQGFHMSGREDIDYTARAAAGSANSLANSNSDRLNRAEYQLKMIWIGVSSAVVLAVAALGILGMLAVSHG